MSLLVKAIELAKEIKKSPEYARLIQAEETLSGDVMGQSLLEDLRSYHHEYRQLEAEGIDMDGLNRIGELIQSQQEYVMGYEVTQEYIHAKEAFDRLMKGINKAILSEIKDCGEECGSCNGCR